MISPLKINNPTPKSAFKLLKFESVISIFPAPPSILASFLTKTLAIVVVPTPASYSNFSNTISDIFIAPAPVDNFNSFNV